jgi:putative ABC transport system permease protein
MFESYIRIAWRNITKNRFYSIVNIIGLSAGISFSLIIGAYIWSELKVNEDLKNAGNQYILQSKWKDPNQGLELTTIGPLAKALKENYPALVANYYRWDGISTGISKGDKNFREGVQICDSTLFQMYGFKLLHGNPQTALKDPFSVVMTDKMAMKYFGKTEVTGETITIENFSGSKHEFLITGVLVKPFRNSVTFITEENDNQLYIPTDNLSYFGRNMDWNNRYVVGYIELQKGVKPEDLEAPIKHLVRLHAPPEISANVQPFLVPLKEYYLSANNGLIKKMLLALSAFAFFILTMAAINFINLSISKSSARMREIGVRKVLGGLKRQLVFQFLIESTMLVSLSMLLALIIYSLTKDWFGFVLEKDIPGFSQFPVSFVAYPFLLIISVGLASGIYPALVLSSLKSVESLKGKLAVKENVWLRKSLIGFQFGMASIAFAAAIIITQQINLFFSKDLGFDKEYIISAPVPRNWSPEGVKQMEYIRSQFLEIPQVSQITLSYGIPDGNGGSDNFLYYKPGADSTTAVAAESVFTDEYFSSTFGIPMIAGVFFAETVMPENTSKLVINETQSKALGWNNPHDAIGKELKIQNNPGVFTIAGVIKDFHFASMQLKIEPLTFINVKAYTAFRYLSFKLKPGDLTRSISTLQNKWSQLLAGTSFEYSFIDDKLKRLYKTEIQLKQASFVSTLLSVIIVLLGVLGLVSLSVQKRTKEIGIRKLLGSSVVSIVVLFFRDILSVVLIAGVIACPLGYMIMNKWLSDYVYRIDLTGKPFLISILVLTVLSVAIIFMQTMKTALSNPAKSLRTE